MKGSVRPTARLQFFNFLSPLPRESFTQQTELLSPMHRFTFVQLHELTSESWPLQTHFHAAVFKAASLEQLPCSRALLEYLVRVGKAVLLPLGFVTRAFTRRSGESTSFFNLSTTSVLNPYHAFYHNNSSIFGMGIMISMLSVIGYQNPPECFFSFFSNCQCLFLELPHPPPSVLLYKVVSIQSHPSMLL